MSPSSSCSSLVIIYYLVVRHDVIILVANGDLEFYVLRIKTSRIFMIFYGVHNLLDSSTSTLPICVGVKEERPTNEVIIGHDLKRGSAGLPRATLVRGRLDKRGGVHISTDSISL